MTKTQRNAISPSRAENYPEWYQQVIQAADLAENAPVRGCMVIKPWGYAIWENIQRILDEAFKATGHVNAYFPLLIPLSFLEKEAQHIEGFAKECAVVTHHRLTVNPEGRLQPSGELEEPLVVRPTSETIIGVQFSKWIQSYRDLPLLINQWANVMRWEMRTRLFLRTSEFLWQEGHTAHSSASEAIEETRMILDLYADFIQDTMAIPVIKGEKTPDERFPGAQNSYTLEAMMQDCKALQIGTSHFLGQRFSKSFDITFSTKNGDLDYAWTTSWGVSTRLIGGLIMTHSDDDGLVLPPKLAPTQIIILPIYRKPADRDKVLAFCNQLQQTLRDVTYHARPIQIAIDDRDINGGEKKWLYIKKGVPIRLEIGPRDVDADQVTMACRNQPNHENKIIKTEQFVQGIVQRLDAIQDDLFKKALAFQRQHTQNALKSKVAFKDFFQNNKASKSGFVQCYSCHDESVQAFIKPLNVSARCLLTDKHTPGLCLFTGKETNQQIIYGKSY